MNEKLSKRKSETLYNKFVLWREKLLQEKDSIIIVEGKRDIEVLKALGITEKTRIILGYSQQSLISVEEYISQGNFKEFVVIPLVDFDKQGQEYLQEIHEISENLRIKVDSEIRRDLYNLTHGKLPEFEDLFYFLKKKLHPNYYLVLTQSLNIEFEY